MKFFWHKYKDDVVDFTRQYEGGTITTGVWTDLGLGGMPVTFEAEKIFVSLDRTECVYRLPDDWGRDLENAKKDLFQIDGAPHLQGYLSDPGKANRPKEKQLEMFDYIQCKE